MDIMFNEALNHSLLHTDAYEEKVAFTAFMTQHNQVSGSVGSVIRFDGVVVNDGGAYNPHAGGFVAPYDGSYWFYVHLEEDHVTAIDFRKNGAEQVRCDRDNVLPILTCGVVMKLTAGATVTVNHALDGSGSILPLDKQSWFTGFLFH
nr:hypothetical protein BaRGS_030923 [Batillaria attramentaria]